GGALDPDDRAAHDPRHRALEAGVHGVVGGDVLEVPGHGVEAQAAAGVDVAEADQALGRIGAPDDGDGRHEALVAGVLHGAMLPAWEVREINRLTAPAPAWCSGDVLGTGPRRDPRGTVTMKTRTHNLVGRPAAGVCASRAVSVVPTGPAWSAPYAAQAI